MKQEKQKKKVFVGMSGGVDSSVSAALLKKAGFDVVGVFIKVWQPDFVECTWREDRLDAMRICAKLHIPFFTLDLEKEYKKDVADYMISEYKVGRTPNPDVMCNKYIKFGAFFDWAMKKGADFVATGHYARVKTKKSKQLSESTDIFLLKNFSCSDQSVPQDSQKTIPNSSTKRLLLAGTDKNKDQSYFLWTLTQKQLTKTIFPIGDIKKTEVRKIAKKLGLSTADKKDSQGVCFLGKFDMKDFLSHYMKGNSGKVLNEDGKEIGNHRGVIFYTIGQRHGFEIIKKTTSNKPLFVIEKNLQKNTITVSENPIQNINEAKDIEIGNVNWTSDNIPDLSKKYSARIRYRQPLSPCKIKRENNNYIISFDKYQKSVSSGQSVVIYDREICLGGGIII